MGDASVTPFRLQHRLRVRWAEVDLQGIVFNAHYLAWLDVALTEYWRALGLPYVEAMALLGGDLYVKKADLTYHASARLDDWVDLRLRCAAIGRSSLRLEGRIECQGRLLVSGELLYVFADPATQTSRAVPEALRTTIEAFETGQAVTELTLGDWATLGERAAPLRQQVFIHEQGVPADMEWDADDALSLHALLCNRLGQVLATGRLLPSQDGQARLGRMAVHRAMRGAGCGRQVLLALMAAARQRGDHSVLLHAQAGAEPFYAAAGYVRAGEPFDEVGIPHITMRCML